MISEDKTTDILLSTLAIGRDKTCEKFSLTEETLNRYLRKARKEHGDYSSLIDLASMYSPKELSTIAALGDGVPLQQKSSHNFAGETIKMLVLTDSHIGSSYTDESHLTTALRVGIEEGCDFAVHSGDVTEGMSGRDGHVYELSHIGYRAQRDASIELLKQWEKPFYAISGNHDLWYASKGDMGGMIVEDICRGLPNGRYLGEHEGDITVNGITIKLWHGEDTGSYATSYRIQKLIESFTGGEKPHVLIAGHTHKQGYFFERNIHAVTAGSIQSQSAWMRRKRLAVHCGFYIITMCVADNEVKWFEPRFYPFYK